MNSASSPTRTRLLALALAAFGTVSTVSACGGSDSSAETNTGSSASSGGESTAAATSAATPGGTSAVPTSTEGEAAPGTPTGSTECGHGACT